MDALTCIKKLGYVGVLVFATVDEDGAPQVRNISAIHYEGTDIYFLTARGKYFASQLKRDGRVQILGTPAIRRPFAFQAVPWRFQRTNRSSGGMCFIRSSRISKTCIPARRKISTRCS